MWFLALVVGCGDVAPRELGDSGPADDSGIEESDTDTDVDTDTGGPRGTQTFTHTCGAGGETETYWFTWPVTVAVGDWPEMLIWYEYSAETQLGQGYAASSSDGIIIDASDNVLGNCNWFGTYWWADTITLLVR